MERMRVDNEGGLFFGPFHHFWHKAVILNRHPKQSLNNHLLEVHVFSAVPVEDLGKSGVHFTRKKAISRVNCMDVMGLATNEFYGTLWDLERTKETAHN